MKMSKTDIIHVFRNYIFIIPFVHPKVFQRDEQTGGQTDGGSQVITRPFASGYVCKNVFIDLLHLKLNSYIINFTIREIDFRAGNQILITLQVT